MSCKESVVQFGQAQGLLGILCEPSQAQKSDLCVIMLNAGLLHRVGPFRLHVLMARRLAQLGVSSLRLDLSGLGDSASRRSGKSVQANATEDVREAMDEIRARTDARRFVLAGLCSGAENAHYIGLELDDIAGLILIDGFLHRTKRYYWHHYLPRLMSPSKLIDWSLRRIVMFMQRNRESAKRLTAAADIWNVPSPPIEQISGELQTIIDKGTKILAVYTGGLGYCSYEDQMRDAYQTVDFKGQLTTALELDADHTFSIARHRERLFDLIDAWVTDQVSRDEDNDHRIQDSGSDA